MNIDRKYKIHAVNPCSRNTHDEYDSILFLAKDKAVPAMLRAYLKESEKLGANPAHLESIGLLIGRVEQYQREVEAKIPDTDLPCEIRRCVDGEGVSDNKLYLAPGAQPAPSIPEGWLRVIDEALVTTHIGVANPGDTYEEAKAKLERLIGFHVDVAIEPTVNGGWKLVPIEPTHEMLDAGEDTFLPTYTGTPTSSPTAVYRAMLDVAPEAKP